MLQFRSLYALSYHSGIFVASVEISNMGFFLLLRGPAIKAFAWAEEGKPKRSKLSVEKFFLQWQSNYTQSLVKLLKRPLIFF